jgi:hypothetical protein
MKKKVVMLLLTMIFLLSCTGITYAYTYYGSGHNIAHFHLQNDCTTTLYNTAITSSKSAWTNTSTPVYFLSSNDTDHYHGIENYSYADTTNAYYSPSWWEYIFFGRATVFTIYLNDYKLSNATDNYRQSVIVHELGHAFCLDDNPAESPSIMRYDRNRETMIVPQQDDIDGVNEYY